MGNLHFPRGSFIGHVFSILSKMETETPLIFKRKKAKSAQRTRDASPENDSATTTQGAGDDSPSILATKLKNKVKRAQPKSRLSFGGADDEVCV